MVELGIADLTEDMPLDMKIRAIAALAAATGAGEQGLSGYAIASQAKSIEGYIKTGSTRTR